MMHDVLDEYEGGDQRVLIVQMQVCFMKSTGIDFDVEI